MGSYLDSAREARGPYGPRCGVVEEDGSGKEAGRMHRKHVSHRTTEIHY
ncbi:unnamed protein product [Amoebophrya sp. A25]|nr:unnamed protein product [Amoebophrya sp. A25]|eukprot:GSA25T00020590001.1